MAECRLNFSTSTLRLVLPFSTTSPRMFTFTWIQEAGAGESRCGENRTLTGCPAHQTGASGFAVSQAIWKHQEMFLFFVNSKLTERKTEPQKNIQRTPNIQALGKVSGTYGETGVADLSPTEEVEEAMDAGQLTAHQPLPLHHAPGLPAVEVIDGGHHHHVCAAGTENQTETQMTNAS